MTRHQIHLQNERAISDIMGYVAIFGLLIASVGIVATLGVGQLDDVHADQQTVNADRSLSILADNIEEIGNSRTTARTNDIALDSGRLSTLAGSGPSEVTVDVLNTSVSETLQMNTLVFEGEEERIVYEGGSIVAETRSGAHVLRRTPSFVCRDDRAIVSVYTLQGPTEGIHFGGGTASVDVKEAENRLVFPVSRTGADSLDRSLGVEVEVDSEYDDAWDSYFSNDEIEWQHVTGTTYECDADSVHVRQTTVNVSVSR